MIVWLVLMLVLAGAVGLLLGEDIETYLGITSGQFASLVVSSALLIVLVPYFFNEYRGRVSQGLRHASVWVGLVLVLFVGYAFRNEVGFVAKRVGMELAPPGTVINSGGETVGNRSVVLRRREDGHFVARALVNGEPIQMMVDTGASSIVLRPADAERAGIDMGTLDYSSPVSTANGMAFAAPVRIARISIGPFELNNARALVTKPGALSESLLGMNFLEKVNYKMTGELLTLSDQ